MSSDTTWTGSMPETYDQALGPALFGPYARHLANHIQQWAPERVLEIAAGTGIATAELIRALPDAKITATDLNPAMVAWASANVPGATWQQADAQALDFPNDSFDAVVCQFGAMFFPDRPAAYAESARVLKAAGKLIFSVWDVVEGSDFTAALVESLAVVLPQDPPDFIVRVPHGYHDPEQIRADVIAGGLVPEAIERVVLRGSTPSAETFARGLCLGSPLRFALQERGPLDTLTAAVATELTARLGPGPLEGGLAALVVTARRAS